MATSVVYQLSTSHKRKVDVTDCALYEAFSDLVDDDGDFFDGKTNIVMQNEGYHRAVCINPDAVDYISIPTHLLEKSRDEASTKFAMMFGRPTHRDRNENPSRQTTTEWVTITVTRVPDTL